VLVAAFGVVALALGLDAGDGASTARTRPQTRTVRSLSRADVERIARRVERLRGLRFTRRVRPLFVDRRRGTELARGADATGKVGRGVLADAEELKLLGLLKPSDDLPRLLRAIEREQILGFYDPRSKRLVVVKDVVGGAESRALQEITLAHELTHALEDQHFDLPDPVGVSDDRAGAETAVLEGTAVSLQTDYTDRYIGLGQLLGASLTALSGTETKLPPYIERSLLFPYVQGEQFVSTFRAGGSWRPVNRILRLRMPRTTEQIIHPDKYARGERPAPLPPSHVKQALGRGWRRLDVASVGEFDVGALIDQLAGRDGALAAAGWNGGRLELMRRGPLPAAGCQAPCVTRDVARLALAWDTVRDATEAAAALRRACTRGLHGKRLAAGHGLDVWASRGGVIALAAGGERTTLVFAPNAALAARVLRRAGG
jgi:hypothetical protein